MTKSLFSPTESEITGTILKPKVFYLSISRLNLEKAGLPIGSWGSGRLEVRVASSEGLQMG